MSLTIVNTGANDDIGFTNRYSRGRSIHRQVPARVSGDEILHAVGVCSVVQKGNGKDTAIGADHPTCRVHTLSLSLTRIGRERNGNHSVGFRPDEWQP